MFRKLDSEDICHCDSYVQVFRVSSFCRKQRKVEDLDSDDDVPIPNYMMVYLIKRQDFEAANDP